MKGYFHFRSSNVSVRPTGPKHIAENLVSERKARNGMKSLPRVLYNPAPDLPKGWASHLFVFSNRRRNRVKVMYFDGSGLWVCAKRLEKGTFNWPEPGAEFLEMTSEELMLLLGGVDLRATRKRRWFGREEAKCAM